MGLALRFQFLQGTYQAAEPGQIAEPEWPPHPVRVHAALVAAGWAKAGDELPRTTAMEALRWLESAGPPSLALPAQAGRRSSPTVYVRRNPTTREVGAATGHLRRGNVGAFRRDFASPVDRTFPTTVLGDKPVWFAWPDATPDRRLWNVIDELATYVSYLGSSRSPVACAVTTSDRAPAATHLPVAGTGTFSLRVASAGLTDELVANRHRLGGIAGASQSYRVTGAPATELESPAAVPLAGPFGTMVILQRSRGFSLTLAHAAIVARALRNAVFASAGDDAPAILHGHGRNPHVAFIPLATVGHRYAGGEIRGFALVLPSDASKEEEQHVIAAARRTTKVAITREIVPWRIEHVPEPATATEPDLDSALRTLDPARWIGPSKRWATATPVVLDRHTRHGRSESAEDMVRLAFANALLPEPVDLAISKTPFVGGAVPVGVHAANGSPRGALWHVVAQFERPLRGPVLVGRGRYQGIGVFVPIAQKGRSDWREENETGNR